MLRAFIVHPLASCSLSAHPGSPPRATGRTRGNNSPRGQQSPKGHCMVLLCLLHPPVRWPWLWSPHFTDGHPPRGGVLTPVPGELSEPRSAQPTLPSLTPPPWSGARLTLPGPLQLVTTEPASKPPPGAASLSPVPIHALRSSSPGAQGATLRGAPSCLDLITVVPVLSTPPDLEGRSGGL